MINFDDNESHDYKLAIDYTNQKDCQRHINRKV